jgi:hypothetical protein
MIPAQEFINEISRMGNPNQQRPHNHSSSPQEDRSFTQNQWQALYADGTTMLGNCRDRHKTVDRRCAIITLKRGHQSYYIIYITASTSGMPERVF